ncbi:unnamed protein product [Amaranthus hypochondriacus]
MLSCVGEILAGAACDLSHDGAWLKGLHGIPFDDCDLPVGGVYDIPSHGGVDGFVVLFQCDVVCKLAFVGDETFDDHDHDVFVYDDDGHGGDVSLVLNADGKRGDVQNTAASDSGSVGCAV